MPNLNPVPDSVEHLDMELDIIDEMAGINVIPYGAITVGEKGKVIADLEGMAPDVCAFSDDGVGLNDPELMKEAMERAKNLNKLIVAHCEDLELRAGGYIHDGEYARLHSHKGISSESEWKPIERDLKLAEETGCGYHVCHISTKESVALIRKYKAEGVRVTCETAPHYLTLCEDDLREEGRFKMNPPLRSAGDRTALIEGLCDGTIDCIATDHAPHTDEEKGRGLANSPFGIVGLETSFAVLYTHLVCKGIISLERMVELMTDAPRRAFRISGKLAEGEPADLALFDVENEYPIDSQNFKSKGKATPFDGWKVRGRCLMTLKGGYRI